jgi:hypothetical protein
VSVRVKKMAAKAALLSPGILTRMKSADQTEENPEIISENPVENNKILKKSAGERGGIGNLLTTPPFRRGQSTTAKKHRILKADGLEGIQGAKP